MKHKLTITVERDTENPAAEDDITIKFDPPTGPRSEDNGLSGYAIAFIDGINGAMTVKAINDLPVN